MNSFHSSYLNINQLNAFLDSHVDLFWGGTST